MKLQWDLKSLDLRIVPVQVRSSVHLKAPVVQRVTGLSLFDVLFM